ncbi:hypothetical protein TNCV_3987671 [Trichonephila clavipes]|nr:hypothetical protein TNCV_3987671 [Trichonephila clavipes]
MPKTDLIIQSLGRNTAPTGIHAVVKCQPVAIAVDWLLTRAAYAITTCGTYSASAASEEGYLRRPLLLKLKNIDSSLSLIRTSSKLTAS